LFTEQQEVISTKKKKGMRYNVQKQFALDFVDDDDVCLPSGDNRNVVRIA
jgi:hypothetical protein